MLSCCLDLNNAKIRNAMILKLVAKGYNLDLNADMNAVKSVVKKFQANNCIPADGLVGIQTMRLLGWNDEEIKEMLNLKINKPKGFYSIFRLLFC